MCQLFENEGSMYCWACPYPVCDTRQELEEENRKQDEEWEKYKTNTRGDIIK